MRDTYGLKISDKQQQFFESWDKLDPLDEWEAKKESQIHEMEKMVRKLGYDIPKN